jgi:hypothetical protein
VRSSHILVRTVLSIYSFYLLSCTYSFYYRNPDLLHTHTGSAGWLSASVKSSLPLGLPCRSRLPPLRPTSHSHTYNLHRSSMTTSSQITIMPASHSSTFSTHAATSFRTRARRKHSSCSSCSFYLGYGWLAQHIRPQIHPDLSYLNFFDSLPLFRRSKAAEQSGAHSHEESPSERAHTANAVRSR